MDVQVIAIFVLCISAGSQAVPVTEHSRSHHQHPNDAIIPEFHLNGTYERDDTVFKYMWISSDGFIYDDPQPGFFEVAATLLVGDYSHLVGTHIVRQMIRNMPPAVFSELARLGSVGLFTAIDKTTIFPEYAHLRDRPECAGTCAGACSNTCTGDGRKWDSLAGVGGIRATCLDDNFMCTDADPYYHQYNVLVHEFGHTVHLYALPGSSDYYSRIYAAFLNARANAIWDLSSYAMVNEMEYFAEGTAVFFNTNRHPSSSGGMNGCGRPAGQFCASEGEAKDWLQTKDPLLFDALSFTFTNYQPSLVGGLDICVA